MDISKIQEGAEIKDGQLRIIEKLGEGYTGIVYRVFDKKKNREVALKFLKKTDKDYDILTRRFKDEYQNQLAGKKHANIAEVYEFDYLNDFFYFTSEYIKGHNIFVATVRPSYEDKVKFFIQLLEGLDFIHRNGILHLDIKAENVLCYLPPELVNKTELTDEEKEAAFSSSDRVVKVVDFGLAATVGSEIDISGTPHYVAPEVVLGWKDRIDARADLFSAAVLMYYCLTTTFPFIDRSSAPDIKTAAKIIANETEPYPLIKLINDIPEYLNTIVIRLLARNPEDRFYPNARAVINALLTHQPEAFANTSAHAYLRPAKDRHIGRKEIQARLNDAINYLSQKEAVQSYESIFHLYGGHGSGKTHLLNKLKEAAAMHPDKICTSQISFSADESILIQWVTSLERELSENNRSVLVLADDVHDPHYILDIINPVIARKQNPDLYHDVKPVMIVLTGESSETLKQLNVATSKHITELELKPFTKAEIEDYLQSTLAFKDKEIPTKYLDHLYKVTQGRPGELEAYLESKSNRGDFFKTDKLLFNIEGKIITRLTDESSVAIEADKRTMRVSALTIGRLKAQYAALTSSEREIVNLMAVWDHKRMARPIRREDIINFIYSASAGQMIANLAEKSVICHSRGSKRESRELAFTNPFMQAVIYDELPQEDREIIHDSIAGYLKNDAEALLLHRGYGSGHVTTAVNLIKLAQSRLRHHGDSYLAIDLLNEVLKCRDMNTLGRKLYVCLQCFLIDAYINSGRSDKAVEIFNSTMAIFNVPGMFFAGMRTWKTQLCIKIIPALIRKRPLDSAESAIAEAKKLLKHQNTPTGLIIRNYEGRLSYEQSQMEKAQEIFQETEKMAEKLPQFNQSRVQNNELGLVLLSRGDFESAVWALKRQLNAYQKEKNLAGELWTDIVIADTLCQLGDFKGAEEFANNALALAKHSYQSKWLLKTHQILTNIYYNSGKFDKALEESNKCFAFDLDNVTKSQLCVQMGYSNLELKDRDRATIYFEAALQFNVTGQYNVLANLGLADAYLYKKDIQRSKIYFKTASEAYAKLPDMAKEFCKVRMAWLKDQLAAQK